MYYFSYTLFKSLEIFSETFLVRNLGNIYSYSNVHIWVCQKKSIFNFCYFLAKDLVEKQNGRMKKVEVGEIVRSHAAKS